MRAKSRTLYAKGRIVGEYLNLYTRVLRKMPLPVRPGQSLIQDAICDLEKIKQKLCEACDLPLHDTREFFAGVNSGLNNGPFNVKGRLKKQTPTTQIRLCMYECWDEVQQCRNDQELTDLLHRKLGSNIVSTDAGTISKLRRRLGVHLGLASRGRPRTHSKSK